VNLVLVFENLRPGAGVDGDLLRAHLFAPGFHLEAGGVAFRRHCGAVSSCWSPTGTQALRWGAWAQKPLWSWNPFATTFCWRRGRDSNPRYPCGYNGFQDRRIQPLCHLSTGVRRKLFPTANDLPFQPAVDRGSGAGSANGPAGAGPSEFSAASRRATGSAPGRWPRWKLPLAVW
jgi:hypothetical protein